MYLEWTDKRRELLLWLGDHKEPKDPTWAEIAEQLGFKRTDWMKVANMYRWLKKKEGWF